MRGAIDVWSADSRDFLIALTIYDRITKEFVYTSPYMEASNNEASSWGIASSTVATDNDISIPLFDSVLKGAVRVYCSTNLDNNRYNVYATIDVENLQRDDSGKLGRYCIGFVMRAEQGVKIEAYADGHGVIFHSLGVDEYTQGNPSRSISDLACSKNVIAVGASSSRNTTPQVDGSIKEYNFSENQVVNFSSYGTLNDGRKLPHFCAPGNMIVAPINSYYTAKMNEVDLQKLASVATVSGKKYYWISECGTSMASPHAAGVIACWVQADSSLTVHDVIEIAQSTTRTDFSDINDPKWGAGNIDAYAGLKEVLKRSGVGSVIHDAKNELLLKQLDYKTFLVEMPFAQIETIELYSISGVKVCSQQGALVNAQSLASGVYLIKVLHSKGESIERILIK